MRRTTVKISEELDAMLRYEAARRETTISQVTREALEAYLNGGRPRRLSLIGIGASGETNISKRVEEILAEEWGRGSSSS